MASSSPHPAGLVLRFVFPDKTVRCTLPPDAEDVSSIWSKVSDIISAGKVPDPDILFSITYNSHLLPQKGFPLRNVGFRNGDFLNISVFGKKNLPSQDVTATISKKYLEFSMQDPVDQFLEAEAGFIIRKKDEQYCKHGENGMCDHCAPLKSFDPKVIQEGKIKHISFHSYLRKTLSKSLTTSSSKGFPIKGSASFDGGPTNLINVEIHPLSLLSYQVTTPCSAGHRPWPESICSKCQPSAVSLQRQEFRMIDHLEFESPKIVETLLQFWRTNGTQRAAYMYGRYEPYQLVPLGVKAVVCALFEPAQRNASDGLVITAIEQQEEIGILNEPSLQPHQLDEAASAMRELLSMDDMAASCGNLKRIGLILTDLTDDGSGQGRVKCSRNENTFFLSSHEVMLAAHLQKKHPTLSRFSPTGVFGSRFVTCVISGNSEFGIEPEAYQVSESAVAMVDACIIEPSTIPARMIVKTADDAKTYVPEVMYFTKNEFGQNVQRSAFPDFPVDFLLVNVSHGFRTNPQADVAATTTTTTTFSSFVYPQNNRPQRPLAPGMIAEFIHAGMSAPNNGSEVFFKDFNFLAHLYRCDILTKEEVLQVCKFLFTDPQQNTNTNTNTNNNTTINNGGPRSMLQCLPWQTLMRLLPERPTSKHLAANSVFSTGFSSQSSSSSSSSNSISGTGLGSGSGANQDYLQGEVPMDIEWGCEHCTFINDGSKPDCEMCGLPRQG